MLFWHKHDLEKAMVDLSNFTPFPDEWSVEDKVLFEQAFQFHGKSFHRIRQMVSHIFDLITLLLINLCVSTQLPDKSIAALVRYYYSWKKTRTRSSLMDRQVRRMVTQRGEDSNSDHAETAIAPVQSDSDNEEKHETVIFPLSFIKTKKNYD